MVDGQCRVVELDSGDYRCPGLALNASVRRVLRFPLFSSLLIK